MEMHVITMIPMESFTKILLILFVIGLEFKEQHMKSDTVTLIDCYAFSSCSSLKDITISSSVTYISIYAFASCSKLETITIGENVETIGGNTFYYCSSLKSNTIPCIDTSIENSLFSD